MAGRNFKKYKHWFTEYKRGKKINGLTHESKTKHLPHGCTYKVISRNDWTTKYGKFTESLEIKISKFKERGLIKQKLKCEINDL